jgi:hypothetical protein
VIAVIIVAIVMVTTAPAGRVSASATAAGTVARIDRAIPAVTTTIAATISAAAVASITTAVAGVARREGKTGANGDKGANKEDAGGFHWEKDG